MYGFLLVLFAQVLAPAGSLQAAPAETLEAPLQTTQPETVYVVSPAVVALEAQNELLRQMIEESGSKGTQAMWGALGIVLIVVVAFWGINYLPLVQESKKELKKVQDVVSGLKETLDEKPSQEALDNVQMAGDERHIHFELSLQLALQDSISNSHSFPAAESWFRLGFSLFDRPVARDHLCHALFRWLNTHKQERTERNIGIAVSLMEAVRWMDGDSVKSLRRELQEIWTDPNQPIMTEEEYYGMEESELPDDAIPPDEPENGRDS